MKEVWKDIYFIENGIIYDYRGLYQVSNLGRFKSLSKTISRYNGRACCVNHIPEKMLTPNVRNGYLRITLYKNDKRKIFSAHKIVALIFLPNPENKPEVNHIDGKKDNNCVDNLEWVTRKENMKHAQEHDLISRRIGEKHPNSKKVLQYDLNGNFIKVWNSTYEIKKNLGINQVNISVCCRGINKTASGYIWKYKDAN